MESSSATDLVVIMIARHAGEAPAETASSRDEFRIDTVLAHLTDDALDGLVVQLKALQAAREADAPSMYPVRHRAKPGIRSQQLPTVGDIGEKLADSPLLAPTGKPIGAETLHAVFTAYRDTPNGRRWSESESLAALDPDELAWLVHTGLRKALKLFGLAPRNAVFTRDLVVEAYRLSLHGLSAPGAFEALIGIDGTRVERMLRRIRTESRTELVDALSWVDPQFRANYGMTPDEYETAIKRSR